ncbi:MAG: class I SAM-dependent methyltransferase [Proteobacteria bacterium]|nr:class I SAM-dependent methyltransferase [Pseudomonadota bacterium]
MMNICERLTRSLEDIVKVNHSVLHVVCGTAGYTRLFRYMKRFVGIDFSNKMLNAAKRIHNKNDSIDYEFHCATLEKFDTSEKFDVIFMGPYGHYVPYTDEALQKEKSLLKSDGWIICTHPDPEFPGYWSVIKECLKQFPYHKKVGFSPVKRFENILKKNNLKQA